MAAIQDLLVAIDAFVATEKRILGTDGPCEWGPGHIQNEMKATFPLEVDGELIDAARLEITGMPHRPGIQFRISVCYNAAICRLDVTEEKHVNTMKMPEDDIPYDLSGAHFHSWRLNRRFFRGVSSAPQLHNAEPFTSQGSFDSNLRWFCHQVNIQQPDGRHVIELPSRTHLL